MHGRRVFAVAAAAGLLVSLFAPWYRETVIAPGLHGLRTLTLTRSGWQAFSATELLILVVAALTLLVVIVTPSGVPEEGAPDRLRLAGVVVALLGAIAFVVVLARLTTAPGTTRHALAETMVAIRWGIFLALVCSAALAAAGLRLIRASQRASTPAERTVRAPRASRRERAPRSPREPRPGRTPHLTRVARPDRARSAATRTDGPAPPAPASERRPERGQPARRSDRPVWDEQATGWLDLPD
jgi:MFS family permease